MQVESETVYPNKIFEGCIRIQLASNDATKRSMYPGGVKRKGRLHSNSKQQAFGRDLVEMVDPESSDAGKDETSKRNPSNKAKNILLEMPRAPKKVSGTRIVSGEKMPIELSRKIRSGNTSSGGIEKQENSFGLPHGRFGK